VRATPPNGGKQHEHLRSLARRRLRRVTQDNNQDLWNAIRIIREVVEVLGPVGAMESEEAVLCLAGHDPNIQCSASTDNFLPCCDANTAWIAQRVAPSARKARAWVSSACSVIRRADGPPARMWNNTNALKV